MHRGGSRIFFRRGALVSCCTSTPINHTVFFFGRIPVVLENRWSSRGGGVRTPCTIPLDPSLMQALQYVALIHLVRISMNYTHQSTFTYYVHLSFYFLFNMIIVLCNALPNIFAWKRRLTNFLLSSLIIIITTCKRSRQSTTVIDIRGIFSSSTDG